MNKNCNIVAAFVFCASFAIVAVGCSSNQSQNHVRYPGVIERIDNAQESVSSIKEWGKEKAGQVVDYAAVGAVKAGEAYEAAAEKVEELSGRFKKEVCK